MRRSLAKITNIYDSQSGITKLRRSLIRLELYVEKLRLKIWFKGVQNGQKSFNNGQGRPKINKIAKHEQ